MDLEPELSTHDWLSPGAVPIAPGRVDRAPPKCSYHVVRFAVGQDNFMETYGTRNTRKDMRIDLITKQEEE